MPDTNEPFGSPPPFDKELFLKLARKRDRTPSYEELQHTLATYLAEYELIRFAEDKLEERKVLVANINSVLMQLKAKHEVKHRHTSC